jgi:hypothetical protein
MKQLEQNEIFHNLSSFLKTKGIEIKDGTYAKGIEKSCGLLTDAINLGQGSLERAKAGFDKTVEHMRQAIHEKTAPKRPAVSTSPGAKAPSGAKTKARAAKAPSRKSPRSKPR